MAAEFMWVRCKSCRRDTKHQSLTSHREGSDDPEEPQWTATYEIVQCRGCGTVSYRTVSWDDGDFDPETGDMLFTVSVYPHRSAEREPLAEAYVLPLNVRRIYKEVIDAMNSSSPILSALGLRTLIESICVNQKISGKNLEEQIEGLAKQGVLASAQATILHSHRFLGNVAAHEILAPEPRELVAALEIAETVLRTIYFLPRLHRRIKTGQKIVKTKPIAPDPSPSAETQS
jgi:uncharacterized protein DUF4145